MENRRVLKTEVRATKAGDQKRLTGYAAKYGVRSHVINGQFREVINSGAFERILRTNPDVVGTVNHNSNLVLGRTTSGTLQLRSDSVGLAFNLVLPRTSYAEDLYESVERGDINGCSFAFALGPGMDYWNQFDDDDDEADGLPLRVISDFKRLADIALVTYPAYPETSVDARELELAVEARSRQQGKELNWRQGTGWRATCKSFGLNPDTAGLPQVIAATEQRDANNRANVVAARRRMIDFLLS